MRWIILRFLIKSQKSARCIIACAHSKKCRVSREMRQWALETDMAAEEMTGEISAGNMGISQHVGLSLSLSPI